MRTQLLPGALAAALLLILSFVSCKEDSFTADDALGLVPATSATVGRIDIPTLMQKADFAAIRQGDMYRDAVADTRDDNPTLAQVMEEPETSGVDLDQMAYFFVDVNPEKASESFKGLLLSLKDANLFETLVRSQGADVRSKGDFHYLLSDKDKIIAWTDGFALFGNSEALINLVEKAETVLNTQPEESAARHKDLRKAFSQSHDISFWFSSNSLAVSPEAQLGGSLAELDEDDLKNNYAHGYLDFLDGRIEGETRLFLTNKLARELNKLFRDEVRTDFARYIPREGVALLLTNALNIEGIEEVISARSQSKGFLEFGMKDYDLKIKDIRETFGGDIALISVEKEGGRKSGLFVTDIKDEAKLQRILNIALEKESLEREADNRYKLLSSADRFAEDMFKIDFEDGAPRLVVQDKLLFISGDPAWLEQVQKGGYAKGDRLEGDLRGRLDQHLFATYINTRLLGAFDGDPELAGVKDLDIQADRSKISLRMRMEEEQMNALKYLFQRAEQQYEREEDREPELQ